MICQIHSGSLTAPALTSREFDQIRRLAYDLASGDTDTVLVTYALGSCIGLLVHDPAAPLGSEKRRLVITAVPPECIPETSSERLTMFSEYVAQAIGNFTHSRERAT